MIKEWKDIPSQVKFLFMYTTMAILGNYTRSAIQSLSEYGPSYISPGSVLWPNCVACILMGMLQDMNAMKWFEEEPELFVALTTGYCGSVSSYSTLLLETFEHSTSLTGSNIKSHTKLPNRAYGIMEFLSVLITQLFVSMSSLLFGKNIATNVLALYTDPAQKSSDTPETTENLDKKEEDNNDNRMKPHPFYRKSITILAYITFTLALPFLALIVVLSGVYGNYSRGKWTLPALFGIIGAFERFYLSKYFNSVWKSLPLGTFLANQFAVVIICILTLVQRGRKSDGSDIPIVSSINACHVVSGLVTGYCGSLSTISTFINEGFKLPFIEMINYFTCSIAVSYIFCVIILGSYAWSKGLVVPIC
ncbi:hypothetical protein TPHA_0M00830 [Tetrapisispora phaffii CBS 4417]|uniref:Uncharacterized protein n=1 Tax=Tetrapisispora phaffii (strain ATCC 24235 / CBS 4417 / NBRC 1672 / NRRL Y-8282 / UCD 70-5) TaxID=1071381 RepID=G8C0E3_TETPH|nr:hypothetical protein TPHA_0M00830 [Tetrapisispora phaffii CBS 4417]CCE65658.1 hypothetical protein TPHA_0M00830 [Tetrapisispora phaffii CBS 4417]